MDNQKKSKKIAIRRVEKIPRLFFANLPTPLQKLANISGLFKKIRIFIKRDDLTGNCFGGNKERMLEFIIADAVKKNATTLVTVGDPPSNHCRLTAALANKLGLKTELIIIDSPQYKGADSKFFFPLYNLLGAKIHKTKKDKVKDEIENVLSILRRKKEKPYFIEGGGHNPLGAIAYIETFKELNGQLKKYNLSPKYLVLPTGTGTTQAGLIMGAKLFNSKINIIGISVSRKKKRCLEEIKILIDNTSRFLKIPFKINDKDIMIYDKYIGKEYGIPTKESEKIMKLTAQKEGLIIDPIYNAKAMAGLFDLIRQKKIKGLIIYLHTGGLPAVFAGNYIKNLK